MDKNLIKMVLVMVGVMFLFQICNRPKPTDKQSDAESTPTTDTQTIVAPITETEQAFAIGNIKAAGTYADGTYRYRHGAADLSVCRDSIFGTVAINDTLTLTYDQIVHQQWPTDFVDQNLRNAAITSLRDAINTSGRYGRFAQHLSGDNTPVDFCSPDSLLKMQVSPRGGYISRAVLTQYKSSNPATEGSDVELIVPGTGSQYYFTLTTAAQSTISTAELYFTPKQVNDSTLEMTVDLGEGAQWGYRYTAHSGTYIVTMDIIQRNMAAHLSPTFNAATMHCEQLMPRQERGRTFEERNSGVYYKYETKKPDDLNSSKSAKKTLEAPTAWIAFKNQFFSTVFVPRGGFEGNADVAHEVLKDDPNYVKRLTLEAQVAYDVNNEVAASIDIFMGPNLYSLLRNLDDTLEKDDLYLTRLIPLGWSWLRWINTLIVIPVFNFLSSFGLNYGIIILLLTIFIKIILFPFTYKSYLSQAKMRLLAPEVKAINEKYPNKEDAMKRQQETMALYSKAAASPFSGCLPLLLQMPILIAMFSFFPSCIELRGQSFLWVKDLAAPDVICTLPFTIPFYGNHVSLFCLLMTITNIIYTRINMASQPSQQSMPGMKWMMYLMPLMFLFFFNDYAAALSYYYFLSLLITIIQTYIFRHCVNEEKLRAKMRENAAKPRKKSGFMARLEEAQRRQQAQLREQQNRQQRRRR